MLDAIGLAFSAFRRLAIPVVTQPSATAGGPYVLVCEGGPNAGKAIVCEGGSNAGKAIQTES